MEDDVITRSTFMRACALLAAAALSACTSMRVAPPDEGLVLTLKKSDPSLVRLSVIDARSSRTTKNTPIDNGIVVSESILTPAPLAFVRDELARHVMEHPKRAALEAMLVGKETRLTRFDVMLTLGTPVMEVATSGLPPAHAAFGAFLNEFGRRKVISVHVQLEVDGKSIDGHDSDDYEATIPSSHAAIAAARLSVRRAVEAMAEALP
jgi:outer membrane protein assembly factor BamE (lipoprotein component of BamABCDE complex)